MSYPEVKILGIEETPDAPEFVTEVFEPKTIEDLDEVMAFYKAVLIPQLACAYDGSHPAIPHPSWILADDKKRTVIIVRDTKGKMHGVWIAREGQILYPCANNDYIALIYRTLWDETIKHFDYVWAFTNNPVIQGFISKAVRNPPLPSTPVVNGDRLEWHKK